MYTPKLRRAADALINALNGSLLRNSLYILATAGVTSCLGYLFWIIAARLYAPADVGLTSALIAALAFSSSLSTLGFDSYLVQSLSKRVSGHDWSLALNTALASVVIGGLVAALITVILLLFSPQFATFAHSTLYIAIFVVSVPLFNTSTLQDAVFTGERVANNMLIRNIVFAAGKLALLILFIPLKTNGLGIFISWVLAGAAAVGVGSFLVARLGRGYQMVTKNLVPNIRSTLPSAGGHYVINTAGSIGAYLMPVLVTIRLSATENAYFYPAWLLRTVYSMISVSVSTSLFAEGSYEKQDIARKIRFSILILAALLLPVMAILLVGGRFILGIFGPAYAENALPLYFVLIASAIPDAITNVYTSVLRVEGRLGDAARLNVGMAVIALILAWILLPPLGLIGAGWAWIISQVLGSIVVGLHLLSRNNSPIAARLKRSLPLFMIVAALVVVVMVGGCSDVPLNAAQAADTPATSVPSTDFVRINGTQFALNGQPFYVGGVNIHYLSWASQSEVDHALGDAAALHATTVRTILGVVRGSLDGKTVPTIWKFDSGSDSSNLNVHGSYLLYWDTASNKMAWNDGPNGLQKMDYVIAKAQSLNLKLVISLMDFWPYTGGAQQMRAWYGSQDEYTFFFTDPRTQQDYKDWAAHVLNHVNTITGIAYKDDPTILGWDLMNEPTAKWGYDLQAWIKQMSAYVKSIDSNHLLSSGAANFSDRMPELAMPTIDFGTWHAYPTNYKMPPLQLNQQIADFCAIGKQDNKPVLLEEFGYAGSNADQPDVYQSWTGTIQDDPNCAGWLLWRLTSTQDGGSYPSDNYDKYDIHNDGSKTTQVIQQALTALAARNPTTQQALATAAPISATGAVQTTGSPLAPAGIPGKTYNAPYPVTIPLNGDLSAWNNVPQVTFRTGPQPAASPTENGSVTFAAAADDSNLYVLAQVPDVTIIANQHGTSYWEEDSVELYINATGDLTLKNYAPGVAQITIPAADLGKPADNPALAGQNYESLKIKALVFKTTNGYAVEAAIPLKTSVWTIVPSQGGTIGFGIDLNGASKTDRDTKLVWSAADTKDTAHDDPSVFGQLVFYKIGQTPKP